MDLGASGDARDAAPGVSPSSVAAAGIARLLPTEPHPDASVPTAATGETGVSGYDASIPCEHDVVGNRVGSERIDRETDGSVDGTVGGDEPENAVEDGQRTADDSIEGPSVPDSNGGS